MDPIIDEFGRDYLRLVLHIDRHIPGYIDAYIGPEHLRTAVLAEEMAVPAVLLAQARDLRNRVPAADPARKAFLTAQLRAIEGTLRMLSGEELAYLDEVAILYDIKPELRDETTFRDAHHKLDELLPRPPGATTLGERRKAMSDRFEISAAAALPLLEMARAETRARTARLVALPEPESVEVTLVSNQPWSAYNWYKGNGHSLIEFNTDIPLNALHLLETFAHEGYPGHHTEAILKEQKLYRAQGYAEQAAALLHSPTAVIAEGIATKALEMIFPNGSGYDWVVEELLPAAGLTDAAREYPAERLRQIAAASRSMSYVNNNAAILHHTGRLSRAEAVDYVMEYGLATKERAEKSLAFMTHPLYRSYGFTYTHGYDLIHRSAAAADTFLRLLTAQMLPSQLAQENAHASH